MEGLTTTSTILIRKDENSTDVISLNYSTVRSAAMTLRAINHKLRQRIIKLLNDNNGLTVTEIYVALRIEQSIASQHLAILRGAKVVNTIRDGKSIHYSLNPAKIASIASFIGDLVRA